MSDFASVSSAVHTPVQSGLCNRVAIVLSELRAGGMERVVVHLARGLASRGVTPLVICLQSQGVLAAELEAAGIEVVAIQSHRSYDLRGAYRLAAVLTKFRPDIINVHDYASLPYAAAAAMVRPRTPMVFTAHGLLYHGFDGKERRFRIFSRRLRALTAVSPEVGQRHRTFLQWKDAAFIIPNGVPAISTSAVIRGEVRRELGIADDEFVFLAVGNPRPEKAFEDLIAAAVQLHQRAAGRPFSVLIIGTLGDNEYCRNLQRMADEANVPGLRLLGFRSDVQRFYSAADALVVSSRSEGLPMVVLEAMTAGLPILSTRVGGIPDAVPAEVGRLVEPACPEDLARGMSAFLQIDPHERSAMGQAARQHAGQHFGVETMTTGYLNVFSQLDRKVRSASWGRPGKATPA